MKHAAIFGALVIIPLGLMGVTGCGKKSPPGGGTESKNEFVLRGPAMATSLKPGDTHTVTISIDRGKDFKDAVAFKTESPKDIDADLSPATVQTSDKGEIQLKLTAHKDAAVGENTVRVIGTPTGGKATSLDVKVKVSAQRETFSLKGPLLEPSIKQGDTQSITYSVSRDNDFKQGIKFTSEAPKDITVEILPSEVQAADKGQLDLRVTASKSAALGDHTIRVTGTPTSGQPVVTDVKIRVKEPG